jgi:hypothetical protein
MTAEVGTIAAKSWVIYTLMFGYPIPTNDTQSFDNKTACQIYLHVVYGEVITQAFDLVCSTK